MNLLQACVIARMVELDPDTAWLDRLIKDLDELIEEEPEEPERWDGMS